MPGEGQPAVDDLVRRAVHGDEREGERRLTLPPAFQGLPDMAHGGTVLAVFDAIAGYRRDVPRRLAGRYLRRVPLGVPLRLSIVRDAEAVACTVLDAAGTVLVDGRVSMDADRDESSACDARVGHFGRRPVGDRTGSLPRDTPAPYPLPVSARCFVCGIENEAGLRARFGFDETSVRAAWAPRDPFALGDGTVATAALTALLDEAAFWLGALATGESGMTTALDITVWRSAAIGSPILLVGERGRVRESPDGPRYLVTEAALFAGREPAAMLATARITFVTVRGAARRFAKAMLETNAPDVLRRVFPAYAPE